MNTHLASPSVDLDALKKQADELLGPTRAEPFIRMLDSCVVLAFKNQSLQDKIVAMRAVVDAAKAVTADVEDVLPSLPLRSLDVVTSELTFTQLRAVLGFGLVRLKLLLAIRRETCLDSPGWAGRFIAEIGPSGQVKAGIEQAKREVTLEEGT